jgi:hypothetical protein
MQSHGAFSGSELYTEAPEDVAWFFLFSRSPSVANLELTVLSANWRTRRGNQLQTKNMLTP